VDVLRVPFRLRGHDGEVRVVVAANDAPVGLGCDLLDETLPKEAALGFPVCTATPILDAHGYAAMCGWIQLVRSSDASGAFEMDPLSLFRDVNTPFAFFGVKPVLFDAPFRESRYELSWAAESYLCAVDRAVMEKVVHPVAAFTWGFSVTPSGIDVARPSMLSLDAWDAHLPLLHRSFPGWSFDAARSM
jgi:hypothetical protein